ncbi:hypothetical protein [Streptomyces sp. MAR4 CNX-425]
MSTLLGPGWFTARADFVAFTQALELSNTPPARATAPRLPRPGRSAGTAP